MPTLEENVNRVKAAKTAIGNAITNAGGTVSQGDGLEEFASDIGTIIPPINGVVEAANTSIEASLGSGSSALITKSITANGEYAATDDNALGYSSVSVNVSNSYTANDEGKVVDNGALVAQTAYPTTVTQNDTYDTTNYDSITINVSGDDRTLADLIDRSITSINIPSPVKNIGINAFTGCTELTSITFSSTVEYISFNAFQGCTSLTSITIPSTIKSIGNNAFQGCTSLTSITLSNGLEIINGRAFYLCSALTNITIPSTVTSIGNNAFQGCTSLTSITINKAQGSISGAPWGATKATVTWTG